MEKLIAMLRATHNIVCYGFAQISAQKNPIIEITGTINGNFFRYRFRENDIMQCGIDYLYRDCVRKISY